MWDEGDAQSGGDGQAAQERALTTFLDDLDPESRDLLLSVARPVSHPAGATLVRHGDPARGAFVLRQGGVEAVVTLPGGESLVVAKLGAGAVFGEMALVEQGTCTATVRASAAVEGWFIAHEDFRALVARNDPAAIRLQHAVTLILAEKLAALNAQLLACPAPEDLPARTNVAGVDPLAGLPRVASLPFEARAFLPKLPFFDHFTEDEIDAVLAYAAFVEVPRGGGVFAAGTPPAAAFVVVRGAAEVLAMQAGRERRIAVVGPGQLIGFLGVLRERAHSSFAFARESSVLLEIPGPAFRELYFGPGRASTRLRAAVQRSLLASMGRTNRALTRLLSQARLHASRDEKPLEAALAGQLTSV
ncbi:MAG TPA: cyclic nucleotide-binding domain-containing protein [Usitatibacter sp.]|nr:cyclic nucleotide-binding domain-containing protein [Usitatibacter sp.]